MADLQRFARLRAARRVWAVGSIHGDAARLDRLHRELVPRLEPGDRLVYLGNLIGRGTEVRETLDRLIYFRRALLSRPRSFACDVAYLRGGQEEMWHKLLQLQFATDPRGTLSWMLDQGIGSTLAAYGIGIDDARREAVAGALALTRWTGAVRKAIQACPGHYEMLGLLRRAAFTEDGALLFVNAGLDASRPLEAQSDSFWWGATAFTRITEPYGSYRRIVRGFDPRHPGLELTDHTATVDAGCGFGGPLLAACFAPSGALVDRLEA